MTELIKLDSANIELREKVVDLRSHGKTDRYISKELGIPYKQVDILYREWSELAKADGQARAWASDLLTLAIKQYDELLDGYHDLLEKIRNSNFDEKWANQENRALSGIADTIAKRLDFVQKAGLLENEDLGDELADMEEKAAIIIDILQNDLCADCRVHVQRKLQQATEFVEGVVVDEQ